MTPLSDEVLLMALAAALFFYDSALLLYCNEGLLSPSGTGWKVRFGLREPRIRARELYLPAPWLLHRPLYRLSWRFEGAGGQSESGDWSTQASIPTALSLLVWVEALALFVLLPLGFFTTAGKWMLLLAVVALYGGILAALACIWQRREQLALTPRHVGKLAFEHLICPPFALNAVRAVSLQRRIDEDLVAAARRLQSQDQWPFTRVQLLARLDEEIETLDEDSPRAAGMRANRSSLEG